MFDKKIFHELLEKYKNNFNDQWWDDEKYKWEAIKTFQDNWDVDAADFADMLERSLAGTENLLGSQRYLPRKVITELANWKNGTEAIRSMFKNLFDENQDVYTRINEFKIKSNELTDEYKIFKGKDKFSSYQEEHSISIYLWLKYPNKYYIYKYGIIAYMTKILISDYKFFPKAYESNVNNFYKFYDELCAEISQDAEVVNILKSHLTDSCYPDHQLRTMTGDFGYYVSKHVKASPAQELIPTKPVVSPKAAFLSEVFLSPADYDLLTALIRRKKNVILQGAPGVGKTFASKRLAWAMMGEKDESRVGFVQFHQSYSYEDFIMGYKPTAEGGFELGRGLFHNFCQKAAADDGRDYFLIIDEINRGNLSKIFGEALMLIEADKRGEAITLASGNDGEKFSVPPNLFIIGLMNTADRSLAIIDYALRRRFSFFDMKPAFDSEGFKNRQKAFGSPKLDNLIELVKSLNTEIAGDESLGQGFCLGHSYFCEDPGTIGDVDGWLHQVVDYDLIPTLGEYWFDKPENVERWAAALHGALE